MDCYHIMYEGPPDVKVVSVSCGYEDDDTSLPATTVIVSPSPTPASSSYALVYIYAGVGGLAFLIIGVSVLILFFRYLQKKRQVKRYICASK